MWEVEEFVDRGGEYAAVYGVLLHFLVEILAFPMCGEFGPPFFIVSPLCVSVFVGEAETVVFEAGALEEEGWYFVGEEGCS
jgi:hypothetical protein